MGRVASSLCRYGAAFTFLFSFASADCSGTITITQLAGLATASACPTFSGDITVQSITASKALLLAGAVSTGPPSFILSGVDAVTGSIEFDGLALEDDSGFGIVGTALKDVSGSLVFSNMGNVDMLQFQNLGSTNSLVFSNVNFSTTASATLGLDQFQGLHTVYGINVLATSFQAISGWEDFRLQTPDEGLPVPSISINNNPNLNTISLPLGYSDVPVNIDISGNHEGLRVTLPDIANASLRLSGVNAFSAPQMTSLYQNWTNPTGQMFFSNNSFTTLDLSELNTITGTLLVEDNDSLTNLSVDALQIADGLEITNNGRLSELNLPKLTEVSGSLNLSGPISSLTIPALKDTSANINISSTAQLDCSGFDFPQNDPSKVCADAAPSPDASSPAAAPAESATAAKSDGLSTGAKAGIGVGVGLGVPLLLAVAIFLWLRSRRHRRGRSPRSAIAEDYSKPQKDGDSPVSPVRYSKISQAGSDEARGRSDSGPQPPGSGRDIVSGYPSGSPKEQRMAERPISRPLSEDWVPPGQPMPSAEGRVELEEQQGMRHEMDARSLPDIEMSDSEEETRSLNDIERSRGNDVVSPIR